MSNPTWHIDSADERGVPETAHCGKCGLEWVRPDDDPYADTLPTAARFHRRVCSLGVFRTA